MSVPYKQLKIWAGELELPKGGFGMKKPRLITELVKAMEAVKDDLDEDQLEWLGEQTNGKPSTTTGKKKKKKKEKAKPTELLGKEKKKKKKAKKGDIEEPTTDEDDEPTKIKVDASRKAIKTYAKELGLKAGTLKNDQDYNILGQKVFAEIQALSEDEREELSKPLFEFFTTIASQLEDASTDAEEPTTEEVPDDIELPKSKAKLKVWAGKMGVKRKDKSNEEIAREILEEFKELDAGEKEDLPDALVEWANSIFEAEAEGDDTIELPDFDTLKEYALAVGIKRSELKKAKSDEATLASMIVEVYDTDDEDEYPKELIAFYAEITGDEGDPVEEEVVAELADDPPPIAEWLGKCGFDEDDFAETSIEEMGEYLVKEYEEDSKQFKENELEDALAYLKEQFPDMFKKKKKKKKKKK